MTKWFFILNKNQLRESTGENVCESRNNSGSGSRNDDPNAKEFGYYFFLEDYVKLKMMDFMVHKDAVNEIPDKFQ